MKYISIIGSTGSIGTQTLDIVRSNKDLKVTALAAGTSIDLLEKQAREFKPAIVAVYNEQKAEELVATEFENLEIQNKEMKSLVFLKQQKQKFSYESYAR